MLKIILIILLVYVITSCTYLQYKGADTETKQVEKSYDDFDTIDIRSMWILCSTNFQRLAPQIPPHIYTPICDCMMDTIRKTYTKDELEILSRKEILDMRNKFVEECKLNVPEPKL